MGGNGFGDANDIGEIATADAERKAFEGGKVRLQDLEREDGLIAELGMKMNRSQLGVLLRAMTAFDSDKEYRQILKMGNWKNVEKARQAVKAIDECRLIGYDEGITAILDDITAQSAGENMALLFKIFETLTHTTFTTNNNSANRKWWDRNGNRSSNASPLS